jgi:Kef-type K+ transport system membrane component KefB
MIAITLVIVLTSAFVTNIIGIHSIFGGFLIGLLIPHDSGFAEGLTRRIEDLVGVYFLPIVSFLLWCDELTKLSVSSFTSPYVLYLTQ